MSVQRPYIVAGPCSVESLEQLQAVVSALSSIPQVSMIRCGVWKPRTRPGGFEGLGQKALEWIKELKEVANRVLQNSSSSQNAWRLDFAEFFERYVQFIFKEIARAKGERIICNPHFPVYGYKPAWVLK